MSTYKLLNFIALTTLACTPSLSSAGEINYYQNNVTPGNEVWEYVDDCGASHKLVTKKENVPGKEKAIKEWLGNILKLTSSYGC